VKYVIRERSEEFYLQFSKYSTVAWALALIFLAYLSRQVPFVLETSFALRGLTSGALLGGLGLAVFWKRGRAASVITGMFASLAIMTAIQVLPKLDATREFWLRVVGTEIFFPWFTLIGVVVTLSVAGITQRIWASKPGAVGT
jgi:Na+/proline symporter